MVAFDSGNLSYLLPDQEFYCIDQLSRMAIEGSTWYINGSLKAVGNSNSRLSI